MSRKKIASLVMVALMVGLAGCDSDTSAQGATPTGKPSPEADAKPNAKPLPKEPDTLPDVAFERAYSKLSFRLPVFVTHAGDGSQKLYVVEQDGVIKVFDDREDVENASVFLDISPKVLRRHNEEGLLALAFHPKYKDNRQFFLHYSAAEPRRGVTVRMLRKKDSVEADTSTESLLLTVAKPPLNGHAHGNHNGCALEFGPDGFLYASYGDGGAANDPWNNGQKMDTLLAKVIRIDIDKRDEGKPYAVPPDNPFVGKDGVMPEIWACGLRNIWRMSFDPVTGLLYGGDVGQNKWEEIDIIEKGGNYGWRAREGMHDFDTNLPAPRTPYIEPVAEYGRELGISVTGGYVYRGRKIPELYGAYVFADYASGRVWGLRVKDGKRSAMREIARVRFAISSFGLDAEGEILACAHANNGAIYRLVGIKPEDTKKN